MEDSGGENVRGYRVRIDLSAGETRQVETLEIRAQSMELTEAGALIFWTDEPGERRTIAAFAPGFWLSFEEQN